MSLRVPEDWERGREDRGRYASVKGANYGMFRLRLSGGALLVMVSDGDVEHGVPWEHVSVSHRLRCPTWEEMAYIKRALWDPEDCVLQYHPPESCYVNAHPYCLHLWRPIGFDIPVPPRELLV